MARVNFGRTTSVTKSVETPLEAALRVASIPSCQVQYILLRFPCFSRNRLNATVDTHAVLGGLLQVFADFVISTNLCCLPHCVGDVAEDCFEFAFEHFVQTRKAAHFFELAGIESVAIDDDLMFQLLANPL